MWKLDLVSPRHGRQKTRLEGQELLVVYTINGTELHVHKLQTGESGHVNETPERPTEGPLTVPKLPIRLHSQQSFDGCLVFH